jgi:hypothetical protein
MGREIPPSCRTLLTWLPQWSTETLAHRQPNDDFQRLATRGVPWPQGRQRYALSPIFSRVPHASLLATRLASYAVWERGWACGNGSQWSAKIGLKPFQSREEAAIIASHHVGVIRLLRWSGCPTLQPRRPPRI